ncbi:GGDEF domain-containing protein [Alcanivorax sediminis]|uniref:diguanylate cyclase n=1 Tax=Alcanivorax sediminis TaxID=2663008 RepID=A0A6N7LWJ3_9GAMM|nr:GGDEF domain-containing protein [Alcanivorax sediminis]MQX53756.1 diguanylate cyclase [Alcanivorax sediminis]
MTDNDFDAASNFVQEKPWRLVNIVQSLRPYLAGGGIAVGSGCLWGYWVGYEWFYRPISPGPATHPLTALCLLLLGTSALLINRSTIFRGLSTGLIFVVLAFCLVWFVDLTFPVHISPFITPFQGSVTLDIQHGKSNSLGLNSLVLLVGTAASLIFYNARYLAAAQAFSFLAAFIPAVSLVGYLYGVENLYGAMSLWTALAGVCVGLSALCMTAEGGLLRYVLSPYSWGWVFRTQSVLGLIFPLALGFLILEVMRLNDHRVFGVYVVGNIWFILLMVGVSSFFLEKVDQQRRRSELKLLEAATQDQLTGLANRRKFFEFGRYEIQRIDRSNNNGLWLLMMDLDHFKNINDAAGHDMGDKVLVMVSRAMQKSVRSVDLVSRLGGEEFAVLLPDSTPDGAEHVANRILASVNSLCILGWTDIHGPVTLSIGCSRITPGSTLEDGMKSADSALYEAKRNGRNQLLMADSAGQSQYQ